MSNSTNSGQEESYNGQNYTPSHDKVTYLNEGIEWAKPFKLVGNEEQGYCVTFGKYRISEIHRTGAEALEELKNEPWMITINLIAVVMEQIARQADRMKGENTGIA